MKKRLLSVCLAVIVLTESFIGCTVPVRPDEKTEKESAESTQETSENVRETTSESEETSFSLEDYFDLTFVPAYAGVPSVEINGNVPFFTEEEVKIRQIFEYYSELDDLGRCGTAFACVGRETRPTEARTLNDHVHPSGWQSVTYDFIEGEYLYNRCHLIAYSIAGENDNERNLITGTRYLNVEGMLPYENKLLRYIESTGNHVLYRVSPVFEGDNRLASGVLMEAYSMEDAGRGLAYCVYVYNVQPFVTMDYLTGESSSSYTAADAETEVTAENCKYVLNLSSQKIHLPECDSVKKMSPQNKKLSNEDLDALERKQFVPCQNCLRDEYMKWKEEQND